MMAEQSLAISHNILPKLQKNGEISKCFRKKHGEFSFFLLLFPCSIWELEYIHAH